MIFEPFTEKSKIGTFSEFTLILVGIKSKKYSKRILPEKLLFKVIHAHIEEHFIQNSTYQVSTFIKNPIGGPTL